MKPVVFCAIPPPPRVTFAGPGLCPDHRGRYAKGCDHCRARERWRHHQRKAGGRGGTAIPAAEVTRFLRWLRDDAGMPLAYAAERLGLDRNCLHRIVAGRHETVNRDLASRIVAVRPTLADVLSADATGIVRRLDLLALRGYGRNDVAKLLNVSWQTVLRWRTTNAIVGDQAVRVIDLYRRIRNQPGPNRHAAALARVRGVLPAYYWPDHIIDNPDYDPFTERVLSAGLHRQLRALAFIGHGPEQVAPRLAVPGTDLDWLTGLLNRCMRAKEPHHVKAVPSWVIERMVPLYEHLADSGNGPDDTLAAEARAGSWASPWAWYDIDITDPKARAARRGPGRDKAEVNIGNVLLALDHSIPYSELSPIEKGEAVKILIRSGPEWTDRRIAIRMGFPSPEAVDKVRRACGLDNPNNVTPEEYRAQQAKKAAKKLAPAAQPAGVAA